MCHPLFRHIGEQALRAAHRRRLRLHLDPFQLLVVRFELCLRHRVRCRQRVALFGGDWNRAGMLLSGSVQHFSKRFSNGVPFCAMLANSRVGLRNSRVGLRHGSCVEAYAIQRFVYVGEQPFHGTSQIGRLACFLSTEKGLHLCERHANLLQHMLRLHIIPNDGQLQRIQIKLPLRLSFQRSN